MNFIYVIISIFVVYNIVKADDTEILDEFYVSTNGNNWKDNSGWDNKDICIYLLILIIFIGKRKGVDCSTFSLTLYFVYIYILELIMD